MFSRARKRAALIISASAAAAAIVGGLNYAAPAQAATATFRPVASAPVTATTSLTNRPDSGFAGNNWATDKLTRVAKAHLVAEVDVSNCPGTDTGHCYLWDGSITDTGTATTIAGQTAPGTVGGTEDQSLGVQVTGGAPAVQFYSSWKTAKGNPRVPTSLDGAGTARQSTGDWMSQFFGSGAVINSSAGLNETNLGNWSWKYTGNFGFDPACPNDAYQWIDSFVLGDTAVAGNILTPNANDCGTTNGANKSAAHTTAYLTSFTRRTTIAKPVSPGTGTGSCTVADVNKIVIRTNSPDLGEYKMTIKKNPAGCWLRADGYIRQMPTYVACWQNSAKAIRADGASVTITPWHNQPCSWVVSPGDFFWASWGFEFRRHGKEIYHQVRHRSGPSPTTTTASYDRGISSRRPNALYSNALICDNGGNGLCASSYLGIDHFVDGDTRNYGTLNQRWDVDYVNACDGDHFVSNSEQCPFPPGSGLNAKYNGQPIWDFTSKNYAGYCAVAEPDNVQLEPCGNTGTNWVNNGESFINVADSSDVNNQGYMTGTVDNDPILISGTWFQGGSQWNIITTSEGRSGVRR